MCGMEKLMLKKIFIIILLFSVSFVYAEDTSNKTPKQSLSPLSTHSKIISVKSINFNKRIDLKGRGEILEVDFSLKNNTDNSMKLYIFVVALYHKNYRKLTSFDSPVPPQKKIKTFVPFPNNLKNFQHTAKDPMGKEYIQLVTYPKNYKEGTDPLTGKPYFLKNKIRVTTKHLSPYRTNYYYFNHAAITIYNKDGQTLFRQIYKLNGFRR